MACHESDAGGGTVLTHGASCGAASPAGTDLAARRRLVKNKNERQQTNTFWATAQHANKVFSARILFYCACWMCYDASGMCTTTMHWHRQWPCETSCETCLLLSTIHFFTVLSAYTSDVCKINLLISIICNDIWNLRLPLSQDRRVDTHRF